MRFARVRARAYLALLALGTVVPLALFAGILIDSAANPATRPNHDRKMPLASMITADGTTSERWIRNVPINGEPGNHAAGFSDWTAKVGVPGNLAQMPLERLLMPLLLLSGLLGATNLMFALLLARRIVQPVTAVERLAGGWATGHAGGSSVVPECHEAAASAAAQARLNQAQRMQALGQMASGIAHDFNNVLQAIGGALFLIARQPDDAARVARFAAVADDATQRGVAITGRLLSLSHNSELRTGPVDPALLLSGMAELLAHTLDAGIVIRADAAPGLTPLLADRRQLETVLINLATNARDAMPAGGTLTLSATFDPHGAAGIASSPGGYIGIAVADTGDGMDAATLARATELFFTTKGVGHGTGLGLAMASSFAEQSGGALRIESAQGVGTTVRIWLPCAIAMDRTPASAPKTLRTPRLRGRVLLVDDDGLVRATLAEQLQELGLSVVSACDGMAGLRALAADEGITVLVSDLAMPGMDGVALIQAAQRARPGLPAILVTGYAGEDAALAMVQAIRGPFRLLQKPVSPTHLTDCLAELLERLVEA